MSFQLKKYHKELPLVELILYYIFNILSGGVLWVVKTVIKKAINESKQDN